MSLSETAAAFPAERARVMALLDEYGKNDPSLGALMCRRALARADRAAAAGDPVELLAAYNALRNVQPWQMRALANVERSTLFSWGGRHIDGDRTSDGLTIIFDDRMPPGHMGVISPDGRAVEAQIQWLEDHAAHTVRIYIGTPPTSQQVAWEAFEAARNVVKLAGTLDASHQWLASGGLVDPAIMSLGEGGLENPDPPEVVQPMLTADQARMEMVHELHEAVHGSSWARPQSPKEVWEELLASVRARFAK